MASGLAPKLRYLKANNESQRPELILLSLPITLTQFASLAVGRYRATQAVSSLASV